MSYLPVFLLCVAIWPPASRSQASKKNFICRLTLHRFLKTFPTLHYLHDSGFCTCTDSAGSARHLSRPSCASNLLLLLNRHKSKQHRSLQAPTV
jgi:hypothetical protein